MEVSETMRRVDDALRMAAAVAAKDPEDPTIPIVIKQLQYLQDVYRRDGDLGAIPKGKMTIGLIAAREYDTAEPNLADLLHKISWDLNHQ